MTPLALLTVAAVLAAGPADDAADEQAEYARFAGTWAFESLEIDGKAVPPGVFKAARLTLKGNAFTQTGFGETARGTYKVDVRKTPRTIDITFGDGPQAGKTAQGVYELEGDTYKVCVSEVGRPRPTGLVSRPGSGHALEVLKRQKP